MLSLGNLGGNVRFGIRSRLHYRGSRALSFLPLAHAYGCAFDMLTPLAVGTHITILGKLPTPKLLLKAFAEVRPNLIICVPLILEKIYRNKLRPLIEKPSVRNALRLPGLKTLVCRKIRNSLVEALGGEFEEVIVGGAPLNREVEEFLHKIKFPFTVGYGMTECGPLISYTPWRQFIVSSSGRTLPTMESKIAGSKNEATQPGEICVRGENVMMGYFKNPEATEAVLDAEGWLHTGDMGTIADRGTIFIRGRYKTMILGANGQNIYPEEIEAKLNNMPSSIRTTRPWTATAYTTRNCRNLWSRCAPTSTASWHPTSASTVSSSSPTNLKRPRNDRSNVISTTHNSLVRTVNHEL